MSSFVFPQLPGQKFPARKSPIFSTKAQKALSGKESRISFRAYPLYSWDLEYEFLSDNFPQAPARTNYVPWSQDATQWPTDTGGTGRAAIVVPNFSLAPDGTLTASRVVLNKGNGSTTSDISGVVFASTKPIGLVTSSIWMKTNDGSSVAVNFRGSDADRLVTVTPTWTRYTSTGLAFLQGEVFLRGSIATASYADLCIWGAQEEPGSYATPNIFTNGSAVRVSDLKTMFGIFSQMLGQYDTFLYQDQDFNTVQLQQFATGDGSTKNFNLTATYKAGADISQFGSVLGNAGVPEWIQNTNGPPQIYTARYGGPELLSTGSRTNLLLQSNFAATWTDPGMTITFPGISAPDGTTTAANFNDGATTAQHYAQQSLTVSANARYSFSVWLKYSSRQYVVLGIDDSGANGFYATFDLLNGVISQTPQLAGAGAYASAADAQITSFPNGWYRCRISGQLPNASANVFIGASNTATPGATIPSFTGTSGVFFGWGAQMETGTQPTALIPTTTTSVTAAADYTLTNLSTASPVNTFQQVSFATAPANNVPILWSGSFFYRCRFSEDSLDFQKDFGSANAGTGIWSQKKLSFESIIL